MFTIWRLWDDLHGTFNAPWWSQPDQKLYHYNDDLHLDCKRLNCWHERVRVVITSVVEELLIDLEVILG